MVISRRMQAPSLYLQGKGAIHYLGQKGFPLGNRAYVVGGGTALSIAGDRVKKSLNSRGIEVVAWNDSVKECTWSTVNRLVEQGKHVKAHFVVGVGGGRAVDTAKAVAWKLSLPAMTVGTQCATNADCSAESVVYTDDHRFLEAVRLPSNPVTVIEDTEIIAKAPAKYMVWGIGDALATKFESDAYAKARAVRKDGSVPTGAALAVADACFNALVAKGPTAVKDLRSGTHSSAVDDVIEAVKLSSAIAFENTGCALAHAVHNGLTKTGQIHAEHGELVAYGTIVQMVYEKRPEEEVRRVVDLCEGVGLPTRLRSLGDLSKAALRQAAEHAAEKDPNSRNMPERMKPADVMAAMDRVERGF